MNEVPSITMLPRGFHFAFRLLLVVAAGNLIGCSARAVRPPSPATNIRFEELDQQPPPGERYYLMVFGSQSTPIIRPKYTHSWATVVRVVDRGSDEAPHIEEHTISWMPATLDIHPIRFRVEPGVNLDLNASLKNAVDNKERISMWGPFEVRLGAYRKFLMQRDFIVSGQIGYQCIDSLGEAAKKGNGCDCIHAVTDMDARHDRREYPLSKFGEAGSGHITSQVAKTAAIIELTLTHDWLIPALGLDRYTIVRRSVSSDQSRRGR